MKKLFLFAILTVAAFSAYSGKVEHVVLVGLDGLGHHLVPWERMPNLSKLRDEGAYTAARCGFPPISSPNWVSSLTSSHPDLNGFRNNTPKPEVPPAPGAPVSYPNVFEALRAVEPSAYTVATWNWEGIGWIFKGDELSFGKCYEETEAAETALEVPQFIEQLKNKPRLSFLYLGSPDMAGHSKLYGSPHYRDICAAADANIGKVVDAIKENGMADSTALILWSDHGGHYNCHQDPVPSDYDIPFLVWAPSLGKLEFRQPVVSADVSATALTLLGYDLPESWRGRSAITQVKPKIHFIGHRGEPQCFPENTALSFLKTLELGDDGFECDIYLTADEELICTHDRTLLRNWGLDKETIEATWPQVRDRDVIALGKTWTGVKMLRFADVMNFAQDNFEIFVELAGPRDLTAESNGKIVPFVKAELAKLPNATPKRVVFISFDRGIIKRCKELLPEYRAYWLPAPCNKPLDELIAKLRDAHADGASLHFNPAIITPEYVEGLHKAGFHVNLYTINDPAKAVLAAKYGADSITSDCAAKIRQAVENAAEEEVKAKERAKAKPSASAVAAGSVVKTN